MTSCVGPPVSGGPQLTRRDAAMLFLERQEDQTISSFTIKSEFAEVLKPYCSEYFNLKMQVGFILEPATRG